jgi:signal transduction histidine kinase
MAIKLNSADENKTKFISNITHDLRSPLTNIIGYSSGIIDGTIPDDSHEKYMNVILDESIRLKNLVNDILDLSKFESGNISLNKTDFNLNQMILSTVENYENRINNKYIKIDFNFSDENRDIYADKEYFNRVLDNLISNAVKFTEEHGHISISTILENEKYNVIINNSYLKIKKNDLINIFDRFVKLDDSRGKNKISSGLGLAIVKEILKAHGEKIYVMSDENDGITFKFTIATKKLLTKNS